MQKISRLYRDKLFHKSYDVAAQMRYRRFRYPLTPLDFGSVRILRAYCLFIDLIIDNSFVFKHPLSGPNTHSVLESGPDLLFVPRSGLNTTTESLSGPKKRRPATDGEPFFPSISILLNPAKFHAKYVFRQAIWDESITACLQKECLTCLESYMSIQPRV